MIRQTGGLALSATSTRSSSSSRAMFRASGSGVIPIWAPSGPTSRTSRARIRSFIRGSLTAAVAMASHSSFVPGPPSALRKMVWSPAFWRNFYGPFREELPAKATKTDAGRKPTPATARTSRREALVVELVDPDSWKGKQNCLHRTLPREKFPEGNCLRMAGWGQRPAFIQL